MRPEKLIEPAYMIVLTGGPCSGKSSSLVYLTEKLSDQGFMVFVIPETATLITENGIDRRKMDKARQVTLFEETTLDMQLAFEETYRKAVERIFPDRKKVILLDRGAIDIKAFIPEEDFKAILKRKGLFEVKLRDRYTGVIHLVTAADGAMDYYTLENNPARLESPEEAIRIDRLIRDAWLGHPHLKIIDNRTNFEGKIKRTYGAISRLLGIPTPLEMEERFLVREVDYERLPAHQTIHIEQIYLRSKDPKEEVRIRKRGQENSYLCFLTRRRATKDQDVHIEEEELITEREYLDLVALMDSRTEIVTKERICFLWQNQYFELDRYKGRHEGTMLLEVKLVEGETKITIPPFMSIERKVTGDSRYSNRTMAAKPAGRGGSAK